MTTPQYVDISAYNGAINWQEYKAWATQWDGIARVAMRSSYGTGYTDLDFEANRKGALAAGIDVIIFYHYAYPQYNQASAEADWQHQVVGAIRPQDVLMLDYEEAVAQANSQWALEWLAQQEMHYGRKPTIYASTDYILHRLQDARLATFPLTLANWQFTPDERPACPHPWTSYEYLQYTDRASIPGIAGPVDANIFLGAGGQTVNINTTMLVVRDFFTSSPDGKTWTCTRNGFTMHGEILQFYINDAQGQLAGLTDLGLPLSNEIALDAAGNTYQDFERGRLNFDPNHLHDNPPGAGRVYKAHVTEKADNTALRQELLAEAKLIGDTAAQMMTTISQQLL